MSIPKISIRRAQAEAQVETEDLFGALPQPLLWPGRPITCRVHLLPSPAHSDGVLLCADCRANPEAAAAHVAYVLAAAERRAAKAFERLDADLACADDGTRARYDNWCEAPQADPRVVQTNEAARAGLVTSSLLTLVRARLAWNDASAQYEAAQKWASRARAELEALQ